MRWANPRKIAASNWSFLLRCIMARAKFRTARGFATLNSIFSFSLKRSAKSRPYNPVASTTTLTRLPPRVSVRNNAR
jgi:hypothetical protein